MKGSLLVQFMQFFTDLVIVLLIIYSSYIIGFSIFKRNWMNSKLFSETLASVISSITSSTFDVSSKILVGKSCDVELSHDKVIVKIGDDTYQNQIIFPNYVKIRDSNSDCSDNFITINKIRDEVWIE
ncbi:MAG: hypothetical protein QXS37_03040 [Candidatus Aenigmatarchaeota archaeon]